MVADPEFCRVDGKTAQQMLGVLDQGLRSFSARQQEKLLDDKFELRLAANSYEADAGRKRAAGSDDAGAKRPGIERRVDPADGNAYTLAEFCAEYGGNAVNPPGLWVAQKSTSFVFRN